jgi:fibronectin-binding autotransporter adhesin
MSEANSLNRRIRVRRSGKQGSGARIAFASAVGFALWGAHSAHGQALYWGGSGTPAGASASPSGTWAAGSLNWSSDSSGAGGGTFTAVTTTSNNLTFGTADATGAYAVTVGDAEAADTITFATGTATLGGSGTIDIANGGNITDTSGNPVTFGTKISQSSGQNFSITGNGVIGFQTITAAAAITVTVGVLNDGSTGIVTFGGSADNGFIGLTVNSGAVDLAKTYTANTTGTHAAYSLTMNGGTVQIDGNLTGVDEQVYFGQPVTINGGTFDLNGRNEGVEYVTGNGGTVTNTLASSVATLTLLAGGGTYKGVITDGAGQVAVTQTGSGATTLSGNDTFSGGITVSAGTLTLSGNNSFSGGGITVAGGSSVTLNGTNSFTGSTTIKAGTVYAGVNASLGTGNIILGDSANTGAAATLDFPANIGSYTTNFTNAITSTGTGTNTITVTSYSPTLAGAISLSNNLILNVNNTSTQGSTLTTTGNITGSGNLVTQESQAGVTTSKVNITTGTVNMLGTITNNGTGAGTTTINSNIGSNVTGVIENAPLSPLVLSGSNTFTGGIAIKAGTVVLNGNGYNAGLSASAIVIGDPNNTGMAATLASNNNGNNLYPNPLTVTGTGVDTVGVPSGDDYNPAFSGLITLSDNLSIITNNTGGSNVGASGGIAGAGNLLLESDAATGAKSSQITLSNATINNSGTITNSGVGSVTTGGNINTTISAVIGGNVTGVIQNSATSNLTLSATDLYTSATTVNAGTLQIGIGSGTSGKLNGTTGTALTFGGTGTANFDEAASSAQGMGTLTFNAGDATVQSTFVATSATLTFSNVSGRATGATANFIESGGMATTNKIVLTDFNASTTPTGNLLDPGLFFGGSSYAAYDATAHDLRAYNYASDANGISTTGGTPFGAVSSVSNVQMTGAVTNQTTAAINTLNISGNNNLGFNDTSETLTLSGILKSGNTASGATISGGASIEAPTNGELVVRTDGANDALTIGMPIVANGTSNALTKTGLGVLTLTAANTYSGPTYVNAGTLKLAPTLGTNNISSSPAIVVASGATLDATSITGGLILNNGQTLGGRGTVSGSLTVASGSIISAGTSSAVGIATGNSNSNGILTTAGQTWNGGGEYSWKVTTAGGLGAPNTATNIGGTPGVDWDDVQMTTLSVASTSGNQFTIAPVGSLTNVPSGNINWVIAQTSSTVTGISAGTTNLLTGASPLFALNTSGLTVNGGADPVLPSTLFSLELISVGGGNDDLVLSYSAAPEPGTALLFMGGMLPMLMKRRRRGSLRGCPGLRDTLE